MNTLTSSKISSSDTGIDTDFSVSNSLRIYSKLVCLSVFLLIFKGALVTSNDAGLAVPDWPTSFGENMFLYPPSKWKGIIFYEHVHRLLASGVGLLTLILTLWITLVEKRIWVRRLSYLALAAVILQGILGGLTVRYQLPLAISSLHGVLGQTFFVITIILAYSQSKEIFNLKPFASDKSVFKLAALLFTLVYLQLIIGAVMRHSESGLAVLDFPRMAGSYLPSFDQAMLDSLNSARRQYSLMAVDLLQVSVHVLHRATGFIILLAGILLSARIFFTKQILKPKAKENALLIITVITFQFLLGVFTVLSIRNPYITSLHVVGGALLLGLCALLMLRTYSFGSR